MSELVKVLATFTQLPGSITATDSIEFARQFRELLDCDLARSKSDIVYFWAARQAITRLRGASRIIYIGKTVNSLRGRHRKYASLEARGNNILRYAYIIDTFGAITFHLAPASAFTATARESEALILDLYFRDHLEYPPLNRMSR